uniref:Rho guanine nucleotide exchange factor 7-like n=1 Tax=Cyprinus carpio TaxID=7962 RepID=A0A8C1NXF4_CYPCA
TAHRMYINIYSSLVTPLEVMNSAEQTITWLITLGVLESPKKTLSDPEGFLQASLRDGVVLCKLLERLRPGSVHTIYQDPRKDECLSNIREFVKGCALYHIEVFEANDLLQGQNFSKVLNCLVALNKATSGEIHLKHLFISAVYMTFFFQTNPVGVIEKLSLIFQADMSENSAPQVLVKARFNFQQTNEDELSFNKGDIIQVSRQEEGGWWEGSVNGKTGWFPSNYVKEIKGSGFPPKGFETTNYCKTYYNVVVQNIVQTETEYCKELQTLLSTYLRALQPTDRLSVSDISHIMGNLEEISSFQQTLVHSLEESVKVPESQQRIGGFFLSLVPQMRSLYVTYCSNHPSAVNVLTQHSEELGEFMESKGANSPGILTLTTGLSKPFLRLEKYPTLLKEMERHMEALHPDYPDIQKSMTVFKNLSAQCQEVRKRKELELQILMESIRGWEGEGIKTLGSVLYMSQVLIQNHGSEEKNERYLLLFPHVLLMLSASPRMSGFIYQGKLPLIGMTLNKIEDSDTTKNRIQVICNNQQDLQDWVDHLHRQTKRTSTSNLKPQSVSGSPVYHTLPHLSSLGTPLSGMMWGPLEPPKTQKPWSLSCLRPAPPLKPSAALCYKEDLSKSPKSMKKLLPKRKPERKPSDEEFAVRKSTVALEEDAQILKVIEAYCTSAKTRKESGPHMLFPEEEKIIVEETKSNGQTVIEERSLVDTVYALRDEVQELKQDNKRMKRTLEEEQKARKELEKFVRKVLKSMNDPSWDETNL